MRKYNIAVLGATGAVGREMLKVLFERRFPIQDIRALASARSAGSHVPFGDRELIVEEATDASFAGVDVVLGGSGAQICAGDCKIRRGIHRQFQRISNE